MAKKLNLDNLNNINPVDMFISKVEDPIKKEAPINENKPIAQKEFKSRRVQLLIKPSTHEALKNKALEQGISINDLINQLLEKGIKE